MIVAPLIAFAGIAIAFGLASPFALQNPPEPKSPEPKQESKSNEVQQELGELTRAASKLMYADSYRFKADVVRTPNDEAIARGGRGTEGGDERVAHASERAPGQTRLEIDGRFQAGKPLYLACDEVDLVAFRGDHRVLFKTDKGEEWEVLPLDSKLFGGEGKRRIRETGDRDRSGQGQGQGQGKGQGEKGEAGERERNREGDEGDRRREPQAGTPPAGASAGGAAGASNRRSEDVDPDDARADMRALSYLGVIPAPHALLRSLVEGGIAQATRRVEKGGLFGSDDVIYECRLTPQAEDLCRDHFSRLLTPRGYEKVPALDSSVRVVSDKDGEIERIVLEMHPGKEAKHAAIGLRIAYEVDRIGRTEVKVPDAALRQLKE